jgi:copper oxidase (laccase) domain-containing protein
MLFNGFRSYFDDDQFITDLVMPEELKDIFIASMYGRGRIMDESEGDPAKIWNNMSYKYNNINLVAPSQVHGCNIIPAINRYSLPQRPEADGVLLTNDSECFASLRFADCVPVVSAGIYPEPWMLILHSGFAGTVKNIVLNSILNLKRQFNVSDFGGKIWAWIGPSICRKCYCRKKNDPSTDSALKIFAESSFCEKGEYVYFDLRQQVREQLIYSGVQYPNIFTFDACTRCNSDYLYSYRAGDEKRRIFLLAGNTTK